LPAFVHVPPFLSCASEGPSAGGSRPAASGASVSAATGTGASAMRPAAGPCSRFTILRRTARCTTPAAWPRGGALRRTRTPPRSIEWRRPPGVVAAARRLCRKRAVFVNGEQRSNVCVPEYQGRTAVNFALPVCEVGRAPGSAVAAGGAPHSESGHARRVPQRLAAGQALGQAGRSPNGLARRRSGTRIQRGTRVVSHASCGS
jgi:hypothetical protein